MSLSLPALSICLSVCLLCLSDCSIYLSVCLLFIYVGCDALALLSGRFLSCSSPETGFTTETLLFKIMRAINQATLIEKEEEEGEKEKKEGWRIKSGSRTGAEGE